MDHGPRTESDLWSRIARDEKGTVGAFPVEGENHVFQNIKVLTNVFSIEAMVLSQGLTKIYTQSPTIPG